MQMHVLTLGDRELVVPMELVHLFARSMGQVHRSDTPGASGGHCMQTLHGDGHAGSLQRWSSTRLPSGSVA